ncbi:hypothetical protein ACWFMI_26540 [Nocardiopsis terrae]
MATTLDPRRTPHPLPRRRESEQGTGEPVVLADALGDVMAALTELDPDLVTVHDAGR